MKLFKLAAPLLVSASILSSTAFAGGLEVEVLTPVAESYNWTGFYAGLNVGGVKNTMNITDNDATSFNATLEQAANPSFVGGFQAGYRYQIDMAQASGVYGIEFSANFADAKYDKTFGSSYALYELHSENELKNFCLLQLMGGIAADRTLLFVTAGLSWSNISGSVNNLDSIPFFESFSVSKKALGTTVGGGIEYAIYDNISARVEVDVITPRVYSTDDEEGDTFQISNNIVRGVFGLNYRFW